MMQSFKNQTKRLWFSMKTDPASMVLAIMSLLVFFLFFSGCFSFEGSLRLCYVYIIFVALFYAVIKARQKRLTNCFIMASYCGTNYVYQSCKKKEITTLKRKRECRELLADQITEMLHLLPPGKFAAVTHDYVITILEQDGFDITHKEKAYTQNILKLQRNMFGCRKCMVDKKRYCTLRKTVKKPKQFYYIKFEKREGQPDTAR